MNQIKDKLLALKKAISKEDKSPPKPVENQSVAPETPHVASEDIDERIAPSLKIIEELLRRAEDKRKAEAENVAEEKALEFEEQNASVVAEIPEQVFVSMDGDGIGNSIARAELTDDEQKIAEMSSKIESGSQAFIDWAHALGGKKIQSGGDEGMVKIPSLGLDHIEEFRKQYNKLVGATVTVGVGRTISQSIKARMLGKLQGKDRAVIYNDGTEQELSLRLENKGEESEVGKLQDAIKGDPKLEENKPPVV